MKKLLLLLPLITLLTACQSKRELCALFAAGTLTDVEVANKVGIDISDVDDPEHSLVSLMRVNRYCAYYKS